MPKLPWWAWVIIILVIISFFPGLYHALFAHVGEGVKTVCSQCTGGG